jgi:hypothetical protein
MTHKRASLLEELIQRRLIQTILHQRLEPINQDLNLDLNLNPGPSQQLLKLKVDSFELARMDTGGNEKQILKRQAPFDEPWMRTK